MVFLGMHLGIHDTNISLYKDGKCYYAKYERHSGIKHGVGNLQWVIDTLKKWGVDHPHKQIEHYCSCDPMYVDPEWETEEATYIGGSPTISRSKHHMWTDSILEPLLLIDFKAIREMKTTWSGKHDTVDHHVLHTYLSLIHI